MAHIGKQISLHGKTPLKRLFQFAVGNWQIVVAGVPAVMSGVWSYLTQHSYVETALLSLWTFSTVLLSIAATFWLKDRKKPQRVRIEQELAYGLGYHSLSLAVDLTDQESSLQFGIGFQNVSSHGLEMLVTRFDVTIGTRTLPLNAFVHMPVIVPRHLFRSYRNPSFSRASIEEYVGKKTTGFAEIWVKYGPIGGPKTRLLHLKLDLTLTVNADGTAGIAETIVSESEEEVADA